MTSSAQRGVEVCTNIQAFPHLQLVRVCVRMIVQEMVSAMAWHMHEHRAAGAHVAEGQLQTLPQLSVRSHPSTLICVS